ncbi:MAG: HEPN domain-containing protein [Microcystis aeruginosa Ma_QC_Ca_00000000_S207]|nr:HEPN domain-containing protein [Microcystis aeruginosa]TRU46926.1 MAG: HEPN domain-containing protein [Microcystis aeruginosa Ma_QC_Ca_00000000_S207]CCI27094.1 conserved hypothetical protein [Microcystis aeruginosa PCC 9808]
MSKNSPHDQLIRYRLNRAEEAYQDACSLADGARWNSCINRLYYSCFYAVTALLAYDNLSSPKHTGVRSLFNKNYIRSEIISKDFGAIYNELFEYRLEADYTDFADFDELQVLPFIAKVRDF